MKRLVLLALLAVFLLPGMMFAQDAALIGSAFTTEVVPCPAEVANGRAFNPATRAAYVNQYGLENLIDEVEGETYECGIVYVPENYDQPEGRILELFYLRLFSFSDTPAPDPAINLTGGPGGTGSGDMFDNPLFLNSFNVVRQTRDVIGYDQRGTGWSNHLLCGPSQSAVGVIIERDPEMAAEIGDAQSQSGGAAALPQAVCGAVITRFSDVDLTQYHSQTSAQDILNLATALGYTQGYNLVGSSYGTRLALNAMRSTPEQIRSVVLDGVTGPGDDNSFSVPWKFVQPYVNLIGYCEADPECSAAYPNLMERFTALLERLESEPLMIDPPIVAHPQILSGAPVITQIDPFFFIALAGGSEIAGANVAYADSFPRTILAIEEGDIDYLRAAYAFGSQEILPAVPQPAVASAPPPPVVADQVFFQSSINSLIALARLMSAAPPSTFGDAWVSTVLNDFEARLLAGGDQSEVMIDLMEWSLLGNNPSDVQVLIDFATENLTPEAVVTANALAAQMSRADIRATLWMVQDLAMAIGGAEARSFSTAFQNAVNCAEDIPFATRADAQAIAAANPFPQLAPPNALESIDQFPLICQGFPTTLDVGVTEPVVSDIPTLVMVQGMDTHTPSRLGGAAQQSLSNSYLLEWETFGHVAFTKESTNCAGSIVAAFLDDPTTQPDFGCAMDTFHTVQFELP